MQELFMYFLQEFSGISKKLGIMKGRAMQAWRGPIPVSAERGEADTADWLKNPAAADAPRLVTCTIGRWVPYRTPLRFQLPLLRAGGLRLSCEGFRDPVQEMWVKKWRLSNSAGGDTETTGRPVSPSAYPLACPPAYPPETLEGLRHKDLPHAA